MSSKVIGIAALALGCVTAAGAGAYVAVRQNAAPPTVVAAAPEPTTPASPVSETEAVVEAPPKGPAIQEVAVELPAPPPVVSQAPASRKASAARPAAAVRPRPQPARTTAPAATVPAPSAPAAAPAAESVPAASPVVETAAPAEPERIPEPTAPPQPEFEEVVVPSSAVIGLQVDTALSSERARVEDRVEARVTRDVLSAGRVAIPAGSRVYGSVTTVERGGKVKEKSRLGVRFHTLVLANGVELPLRTEAIYREGESPTGESARKIGGAAIGGAIIGAIIGGGKGAATGGAIGAAGGTAAVMAGDRNAATLPAGTILTVRLLAPLSIEVPRQ